LDAIRPALAAGVGVPPDADSVSAAESAARRYWRSFLADAAIALRAQNVSREQVAGAIEHALDADANLASLAGVGEARPAEPGYISTAQKVVELQTECRRLRERVRSLESGLSAALTSISMREFYDAEQILRAALGVVGPPTNQGSAPRKEREDARVVRVLRRLYAAVDGKHDNGRALDLGPELDSAMVEARNVLSEDWS
jgi:hypothetical protein